MKILYTHRTQGVGAEGAHIRGMYEAFGGLGHEMQMHCLPGCNPCEDAPAGKEAAPARAPSLLKRVYWIVAERAPQIVFEMVELAYNVPLAFQFALRCLRFKPDLVYERYSLNTFAPSLVCSLFGIRHVLELNDSVVIERSRPLSLKAVAAAVEAYCLRASRLGITITAHFRDLLAQRFRLPPAGVMVLTNGVSRPRFDRAFDRAAARARWGIKSGTVIGATGQFLSWHGLQELVDRLGPIARERDLRFLFIGDGPAREDVMRAAKAHGVEDRVLFTGMLPIAQVPDSLAALDMAVIPSAARHASPMKLIEYMAMGLPVVAPDLPSISAAVAGPELGVLFPAGDLDAMRRETLALLDDPARAKELGANAKRHIFAELTWTRHAEKVLAALR